MRYSQYSVFITTVDIARLALLAFYTILIAAQFETEFIIMASVYWKIFFLIAYGITSVVVFLDCASAIDYVTKMNESIIESGGKEKATKSNFSVLYADGFSTRITHTMLVFMSAIIVFFGVLGIPYTGSTTASAAAILSNKMLLTVLAPTTAYAIGIYAVTWNEYTRQDVISYNKN